MLRHMRTTIRLSDSLLKAAKKKAAEDGRTLTSIVEEGLKVVLAEPKSGRRARVEVPVLSTSGRVLPGIDLTRSADLEDLMDGL